MRIRRGRRRRAHLANPIPLSRRGALGGNGGRVETGEWAGLATPSAGKPAPSRGPPAQQRTQAAEETKLQQEIENKENGAEERLVNRPARKFRRTKTGASKCGHAEDDCEQISKTQRTHHTRDHTCYMKHKTYHKWEARQIFVLPPTGNNE